MSEPTSDETDAAIAEPELTPADTRASSVLLLLLAVVVFVALVVGDVLLGFRDHDRRGDAPVAASATPAQEAVLAAARSEAVALTTIGYRTANRDLDRILAGSTGALHRRFAGERANLPATLERDKSQTRGTVLSSALSSLTGSTAHALVAIDASVSGSDTTPGGVLTHYRMVMTLEDVQGRWLASQVAFAGVPQ